MRTEELSIGNWVLHNNVPCKILRIGSSRAELLCGDGSEICEFASIDKFQPIPITPEWAKKIGLLEPETFGWELRYRTEELGYVYLSDEGMEICGGLYAKYVHQVQNTMNAFKKR